MADPSVRGSGAAGSAGTSNQAVTASAAPVAGDLILILININNASSGSHPTPACSGFSSLGTSTASVWSRTTLLGKIAAGTEGTSYTITGFSGADAKDCAVLVIQDADSSLPTNIVTTPDASSNTTVTIPGITIANAGSLDIACVGYGGNSDQGAPPNFSAWGDSFVSLIDDSPTSGGGHYAGLGIATATRASAGARGSTTATYAVADVAANIRLEVKPASGSFNPTQTVPDTAAGADAPSAVQASTQADTAAGADTTAAQTQTTIADTGGGADALTPATLTSTLAETGAGSDAITGASTASLTDAGSGTDTAVGAAAAALADTAAGTDTPASEYQFAVADTSTGADAVSAQSGVSLADTATGAELVASALAAAIAETGLGADTVSAGGQDTADSPDSATGVDTSAAGYAATVADAGVAIETATVFLALTVADVATGVDTASQPAGLALVTAHATTVPAARRTVILARAARQAVLRAAVRRVTVQELD
jgi:hypothetical protein